jgi:3-oxoacyl-[acyl-carrier protein] reductase
VSKLTGKVAVVTGAAKGIGAAIAKALAGEGAKIVVNYAASKDDADRVVADITRLGGTAIAVQGDVSRAADVERLFAETAKAYGTLDILVNNAGVYKFGALDTVTEAEFHRLFNINVLGLLLATQQAVRRMPASGGSVINISSTVSQRNPPNTAIYAGTKGAVDTITHVLAKELGPRNIRVNAISPSVVETEGASTAGITGSEFERNVVAQTPLGRVGRPQDIAPAAVFLASDDAAWITGEILLVSGGVR